MLGCFVRSLLRPAVHAAVATRFVARGGPGLFRFVIFPVLRGELPVGGDWSGTRPRRRPGSSAFDPCCLALGCLRLATIGGSRPGGRPSFLWRQERWIKRPRRSAGFAASSLHPRPAGRVETRPVGSDIDATIARPRAPLGAAEGKTAGSASPLPAGCRGSIVGMAVGNDSSPRRRPGSGLILRGCSVLGCLRLAVIGRVSPRPGATTFLVATNESFDSAPFRLPQRRSRRCPPPPAPGGSRRNSPSRAQTSTRQCPPAAGSTRRCRREAAAGSASPLPAGCRASIVGVAIGNDSSPGEGRGPVLWLLLFVSRRVENWRLLAGFHPAGE